MYYLREFWCRFCYIGFLFLIFFCCYYVYFIDFLGYFNNLYVSILLKQSTINSFFIFTHPLEPYIAQIQFCIFFCLLSIFGYIIWQTVDFLKPSLYNNEFRFIKLAFLTTVCTFGITYFILVNFFLAYIVTFLEYFTSFYQTEIFNFYMELRLTDMLNFILVFHIGYVWVVCIMLLQCFLFFILPRAVILYTRKLLYLIFIIVATVITPPDILSQASLFCLLITLFELILLTRNIKVILRQSIKA